MRRYRRVSRVLSRSFAGETLIAAPDSDGFESLTGAGYAVWVLLEEPRTHRELVTELAAIFGQEEGVISSDLDDFLSSLEERRLIEEAS